MGENKNNIIVEGVKRLQKSNEELVKVLANLLEWSVGNRGSKHGNPYLITEVKDGLEALAKIKCCHYLDVDIKEFTGEKLWD